MGKRDAEPEPPIYFIRSPNRVWYSHHSSGCTLGISIYDTELSVHFSGFQFGDRAESFLLEPEWTPEAAGTFLLEARTGSLPRSRAVASRKLSSSATLIGTSMLKKHRGSRGSERGEISPPLRSRPIFDPRYK